MARAVRSIPIHGQAGKSRKVIHAWWSRRRPLDRGCISQAPSQSQITCPMAANSHPLPVAYTCRPVPIHIRPSVLYFPTCPVYSLNYKVTHQSPISPWFSVFERKPIPRPQWSSMLLATMIILKQAMPLGMLCPFQ